MPKTTQVILEREAKTSVVMTEAGGTDVVIADDGSATVNVRTPSTVTADVQTPSAVLIYSGGTLIPSGWAANGGAVVYVGTEAFAQTSLLTLDTQNQNLDGHFDLSSLPNLPVFKCNGGSSITKVIFPPVVPGGAGMLYRLGSNAITDVVVGVVPDTADINIENNALPQSQIDNILVTLAAGTAIDGVLALNLGANAAPSATGLAAKATLEGVTRNWTVTVTP